MRLLARAALAVVLLVLGFGTAVAVVAVHEIGGWGLPLGLVATLVTLAALPPGWWLRLPFALGWAATIGWLATPRREGDYLISADWRGYTVLAVALVVLILGIATLPRPRRRHRADDPPDPPDPRAPEPASAHGSVRTGT